MAPTAPGTYATLRMQFVDFGIEVGTNSLRLAGKLQSYFRDYLSASTERPDARLEALVAQPEYDASRMKVWQSSSRPNRQPKESFYDDGGVRRIFKNRTGVLISMSESETSIVGDLEEHSNQAINLICTLFGLSLARRGYPMLHASAIARVDDGAGFMFLGNSGSGKSSVALQFIEHGGYEFVSNDRVLLSVDGDHVEIVGLPKKPRVNPGTLLASNTLSRLVPPRRVRAYREMPSDVLWQLEEKTDVDVTRSFGARSQLRTWLARAYSLEWRRDEEGLNETMMEPDAVMRAMRATRKDFGPYDLRGDAHDAEDVLERIAVLVPFVRVTGRADPARLAAASALRRAG